VEHKNLTDETAASRSERDDVREGRSFRYPTFSRSNVQLSEPHSRVLVHGCDEARSDEA